MTTVSNVFSSDSCVDISSLNVHIDFAHRLIEGHEYEQDVRATLDKRLESIRKKQHDKTLNLSIIGDFSSGKSTFINALIRQDLLASSVLQGTTVATTIIEYCEHYELALEYKNGDIKRVRYDSFSVFRDNVNRFAAENDDAQQLKSVVVKLPSQSLKNGNFRIIDTPGLDATIAWHEQVTIDAINELSDLSIVLVDAIRPMPDSLCDFVSEHLSGIIDQCIFVVTKTDLIKPRERDIMLKYVFKNAQVRFSLENPIVLPYASHDVINDFAKDTYPKSRYEVDVSESYQSEARILEHMACQRMVVQSRKLLSLVDRIYQEISVHMVRITTNYEEKLRILQKTKQLNLTSFIATQKRICTKNFNYRAQKTCDSFKNHIGLLSNKACEDMISGIDRLTSSDDIKKYLENQLQNDCKSHSEQIYKYITNRLNRQAEFRLVYNKVIDEYRIAFTKHYKALDCFVPQCSEAASLDALLPQINANRINNVGEYVQSIKKKNNRRFVGGLATGAAAGSIIPGVGTVAGAVVGLVAGALMGSNINKVKKQTKDNLRQPLSEYFEDVALNVEKQVYEYKEEFSKLISIEIDRYQKAYQDTVDRWIEEEKAKKSELQNKVQKIKDDMREIDYRRQDLNSIQKLITLSRR